jgi:methylamine dehydrogenase accessory protein MauD
MDWWSLSYAVLWLVVVAEGIGLLVVARAVGAIVLGSRDAIERDGLTLGKHAPDFEAISAGGRKVGLSDLLQTYSALIFASPSCRICRTLLPGLSTLAHRLDGHARIVILLRGSVEDAQLMQEEIGPAFQVWAIGLHGVAERFRTRVSPYLQVLDPSGVVRSKGLVNNIDHVEHLLFEAGVRDEELLRHGAELRPTRG